jgi:hypothetical protein
MTELQVVEWLRRVAPASGNGVVLGIGDDCAVFRPRGSSEDLLFTTDQCLAGVHFRLSDSAESVGHRALGRGLSDIAAMGGAPRFCLGLAGETSVRQGCLAARVLSRAASVGSEIRFGAGGRRSSRRADARMRCGCVRVGATRAGLCGGTGRGRGTGCMYPDRWALLLLHGTPRGCSSLG